jgi:hypothetical protein
MGKVHEHDFSASFEVRKSQSNLFVRKDITEVFKIKNPVPNNYHTCQIY